MKAISGKVVSSKPVSLSKAARILSKFASSDNGASPAFAAYLKRASASFNELVQLHKELKGSSPEHRGEKHRYHGTVTEDAVSSAKKPCEDGLVTEENGARKKHKGGKKGEGEGRELEGSLKTDNEQKGQKRKKKRDSNEIVGITQKDQTRALSDQVVSANGVENDLESQDGSEEAKKKKQKEKIDNSQKEKGDSFAEVETKEHSHSRNWDAGDSEVAEMVPDDSCKRNKSKKKVKDKGSRNIEGAKQRNASDDGNDNVKNEFIIANIGGGEGKKHKKQIYDSEISGKGEIQEARKKDNMKKHSKHAYGGLDNSEEPHKSKKKKKS